MVTKAINAALAKVRSRSASLGRHLAISIKTDRCCSYDPVSLPRVSWQL